MAIGPNVDEAAYLNFVAELYTWLCAYALRFSAFFKHPAYENEQECRFSEFYGANVVPPKIRLRARPYALIR